jgi:hypothetical protein
MPTGNAARFTDGGAAVPEHTRMRIFPTDRKRLIDLQILAGFDTAAAQNALIGIVSVERVRVVNFVRLRLERQGLLIDFEDLGRVVDDAVAVVVIADRAVEEVVRENTIERFASRSPRRRSDCRYGHAG